MGKGGDTATPSRPRRNDAEPPPMPGTLRWREERKQWQLAITIAGRRRRFLVGADKTVADAVLDDYRRRNIVIRFVRCLGLISKSA